MIALLARHGSITSCFGGQNVSDTGSFNFRRVIAVIVCASVPSAPTLGVEGGPDVTIRVSGTAEVVLAADNMLCGRTIDGRRFLDVPDIPASAFRRQDGTVLLLAGNRMNWFLEGPTLDTVKRTSCRSLLEHDAKADPSAFQDNEWLVALYSKDYSVVIGFVHNEYHGEDHPGTGCVVSSRTHRECWYASSTQVVSKDGGVTFSRPAPPENLLAALPYKFDNGVRRAGNSLPKVIANPADGQVYALTTVNDRRVGLRSGQCLFRGSGTSTTDWKAWDGSGFTRAPDRPYTDTESHPDEYCTPVVNSNLMSVRYLTKQKLFVATEGTYESVRYRTSRDLINWSRPATLASVKPRVSDREFESAAREPRHSSTDADMLVPEPAWYFSLLDPSSKDINFSTLDDQPYLYFVRFREVDGKIVNSERDIMRIPVEISP